MTLWSAPVVATTRSQKQEVIQSGSCHHIDTDPTQNIALSRYIVGNNFETT